MRVRAGRGSVVTFKFPSLHKRKMMPLSITPDKKGYLPPSWKNGTPELDPGTSELMDTWLEAPSNT